MIERAHQKGFRRYLAFPKAILPELSTLQTSMVSVFGLTMRWSSLLLVVLAGGAALGNVSYETLLILAPLLLADGTAVSYHRFRSS
ncbi:hypothetical protein C0Q63_22190 [Streptomyces albidoflavus]|nr:hypothetical protein C0Q63_22190 [Streptomyces albidoflavus]